MTQATLPNTRPLILLFQELSFSAATDRFFLLEFDPSHARAGTVKFLTDEAALAYGDTLSFDGEQSGVGFLLASNEQYGLFLERGSNTQERPYVFSVVDLRYHKRILTLDTSQASLDTANNALYYQRGWSLVRVSLDGAHGEDVIASEVTAHAYDPLTTTLCLFHIDGTIERRSPPQPKLQIRFRGVVTEAGFMTSAWMWFYQRHSEYTTGNLYFLNASTGKVKKSNARLPQCRLVKVYTSSVNHFDDAQ